MGADGVASFGHPALYMSPNDPHYGITGRYRSCYHYDNDPENFKLFKQGGSGFAYKYSSIVPYPWVLRKIGLVSDTSKSANGNRLIQRRATFNPHFE